MHYAIAFAAALLTAAGQLLLKRGAAAGEGRHVARLWLNAFTLSGYALLLAVTLMNLYAFKVVPLRANVILSPLAVLLVAIASIGWFGERLTREQAIGCALILIGIAVFNL